MWILKSSNLKPWRAAVENEHKESDHFRNSGLNGDYDIKIYF
jgi:hypothetical protein